MLTSCSLRSQDNDPILLETMQELRCSLSRIQVNVLHLKDILACQFMMTRFYRYRTLALFPLVGSNSSLFILDPQSKAVIKDFLMPVLQDFSCVLYLCVFVCNSKYSRYVRVLKFWFWFCPVFFIFEEPPPGWISWQATSLLLPPHQRQVRFPVLSTDTGHHYASALGIHPMDITQFESIERLRVEVTLCMAHFFSFGFVLSDVYSVVYICT